MQKTLSNSQLAIMALILVLGEFAVELLAPDFGIWMKNLLGGETRRNYILIGALAVSIGVGAFSFMKEHGARKEQGSTIDGSASSPLFATEQDQENRRRMLRVVRSSWIDGVLKKSLWNEARILLNLTSKPDMVVRPCDLAQRRAGETKDVPLAPGTTIFSMYEQEQEELLILGEPGSGKTTLLLEIGEELLNRAEAEANHPIPVVFGLSAWRDEDNDFADWLVKQLNHDYNVPEKIGKRWVEQGALLLLLDGLDEVGEKRRAKCVNAINSYRKNYQSILRPMIVCCRSQEYEQIPDLQLNGAVVIQPLSVKQVDSFLKDGGKALSGLRAILKEEPGLYHELFESPLMLSVAIMTFSGESATSLVKQTDPFGRRKILWDKYIERVLTRKYIYTSPYSSDQAMVYLSWIGKTMSEMQYSIFNARNLAYDLRWGKLIPKTYLLLSRIFFYAFILSISIALYSFKYLIHMLILFALCESLSAPARSNSQNNTDYNIDNITIIPRLFMASIHNSILLILGIIPLYTNHYFYTIFLYFILFSSLINIYITKSNISKLRIFALSAIPILFHVLFISHAELKSTIHEYIIGDFIGFSGAIIFLYLIPAIKLKNNIDTITFYTFSILLSILLKSFSLFFGINGGAYFMLAILFFIIIFLLLAFLMLGLIQIKFWMDVFGFTKYLVIQKNLPIKYAHFLDWCTERILLQRVGNGWRFIHRSLQEHFAECYYEQHPHERPQAFSEDSSSVTNP